LRREVVNNTFLVKGFPIESGKANIEWVSKLLVDSGIVREGVRVERVSEFTTRGGVTLVKVVMGTIAEVKEIMQRKYLLKTKERYKAVYLFPDMPVHKRKEWQAKWDGEGF